MVRITSVVRAGSAQICYASSGPRRGVAQTGSKCPLVGGPFFLALLVFQGLNVVLVLQHVLGVFREVFHYF